MRAVTYQPRKHNGSIPGLQPRSRSSRFSSSNVIARIPLQSKIGFEEPIFDSFPSGEAFWCSIQRFLNIQVLDSRSGAVLPALLILEPPRTV